MDNFIRKDIHNPKFKFWGVTKLENFEHIRMNIVTFLICALIFTGTASSEALLLCR